MTIQEKIVTILHKYQIMITAAPPATKKERTAMSCTKYPALLLLLATICISSSPQAAPVPDSIHRQLGLILLQHPSTALTALPVGKDPEKTDQALLSLYRANEMHPLWIQQQGPDSRAQELLETLKNAFQDGLKPENYAVQKIQQLWSRSDTAARARLDVLLTLALARYVADMREGSAAPCLLNPQLFAAARDKDIALKQVIHQALKSDNLKSFLEQQAPSHGAYRGLRKALSHYRHLEKTGGWEPIPEGKTIKPGMKDPRLSLIAQHLQKSGELRTSTPEKEVYDLELQKAVQKFQNHFLLEPDGIIGKKTLAALNIPVSRLVERIVLNMERWRWLPHRLQGKHIFVNIAAFQLFGATDEQLEIEMPVIVGKTYHKTPVFSGIIRYIEVNPYWNIPNSIAVKEIVAKMQKNPDYLQEQHIRILRNWQDSASEIDPATIDWQTIGKGIKRYRLRQDPGPDNALGQIKFMFPNTNNIYLHDTPARALFQKTTRSFSHGCIRVSRPYTFGAYLLANNKKILTAAQLKAIVAGKKRTIIRLDTPLPVHILYRTVRASANGEEVFFYPDIYGRDALLTEALFAKEQAPCRYPR